MAGMGPTTGSGQDSGSCRVPRKAGSAQQRTLGRRCWAAPWKNLGRGEVARLLGRLSDNVHRGSIHKAPGRGFQLSVTKTKGRRWRCPGDPPRGPSACGSPTGPGTTESYRGLNALWTLVCNCVNTNSLPMTNTGH